MPQAVVQGVEHMRAPHPGKSITKYRVLDSLDTRQLSTPFTNLKTSQIVLCVSLVSINDYFLKNVYPTLFSSLAFSIIKCVSNHVFLYLKKNTDGVINLPRSNHNYKMILMASIKKWSNTIQRAQSAENYFIIISVR